MTKQTKLIAELGNIHLHDIEGCKVAINDAFNAGADLVKLQVINPLTAYWATAEQIKRYRKIQWSVDTWKNFLYEMNMKHNNRVFASTFDETYIESLSSVMPYWKVAFRMRDARLMIANMIWTEKPIFFSTRGKFYNEDYANYFSKSDNFLPLYATEYQYTPNLEQKILQSFKVGRYCGLSINFGGKECVSLIKYMSNQCGYIEIHVQGAGANGPDCEWGFSMRGVERVREELF